ncbi:unnamed protein product, partial [Rotaria magnacalcarata]
MKSKDTQKVVLRMTDDGRRSARKLANSLGVSKGAIGQIIHDDLHLHAYHVTIQPNLKDEHKQGRISFAYWVRKSLRKQDQEKILFFDEKYFELDGIYNRQNDRFILLVAARMKPATIAPIKFKMTPTMLTPAAAPSVTTLELL